MVENNFGDKLKSERKRRSMTQADVADILKISVDYVSKIEKGYRVPSPIVAEQIENYLQGRENSQPARLIPVVSMANGGHNPNIIWEDAYPVGQGFNKIECPHDIKDVNAYAVEVRGSSMSPRYDEGEIVIVDTTKKVNNGSYAVVKLISGESMIKRIRISGQIVILESINPSYEPLVVDMDKIEFMHKITHKNENP